MMKSENQDVPEYLREDSEDTELAETPANLAQAWADAMSEPGEGGADTPVMPEESPTQAWSTFLNADTVAPAKETAENFVGDTESAQQDAATSPAESPAGEVAVTDTADVPVVGAARASSFATVANTTADAVAEPSEDLETTVVRRKSLFGGNSATTLVTQNKADSDLDEDVEWQPRQPEILGDDDQSQELAEDKLLEGASIKPGKISRVGAHIMSLVLCLFVLPVTWAFLKHAGNLLYGSPRAVWESGKFSIEAVIYLVLGLALLIIVGSAVRLSSLGMFVMGTVVTVAGIAPAFAPMLVKPLLEPTLAGLDASNILPLRLLGNFIESSAASGQFLVIGVTMLLIGVIGHSARRHGRVDQISQRALVKALGTEKV